MNEIATMGNVPSSIAYADPSAVASAEQAKARIQSAYIMAMQRPRNFDQARINILRSCDRPGFAELVEYAKPIGGSNIIGPSIRFAEECVRNWGNMDVTQQVVYDDETVRRITVTVTDYESNASFSSSVQIEKTVERKNSSGREVLSERINSRGEKVFLVKATEDEIANKQGSAVSKAMRNDVLRLIPQDLIAEALERARETLKKKDKTDPDSARKKLNDAFAKIGIMPNDLKEYLGHDLAQIQPSELQELRGIYQSISDGQSKWSDYVTPPQEEESAQASDAKRKLHNLKEKLKKEEATEPKSVREEANLLLGSDVNGAV
ncbi:MAG: hypothetical protein M0P69_15240 [Bacteroidales bacterium]|nr:hypothetical protein [Bacteroidales bacterium]